jgi:hypothetical protein
MKLRGYLFGIALVILVLVTCAGSAIAQIPSPGFIATDKGGAVGYQHSLERSRFVTGTELRRVEKFGFAKVVGPDGVFATNLRNGLVVAVQSGGSDKGKGKAENEKARAGYVMDPNKHNEQVVDYFLAAGVPKEQIGGVHANTYLSSSGSVKEARPAPPKIDGYASVIERKIEKYPVVDSVAWARMNERGKVVSEWVYWPAIPAKALTDARRLEKLAGSSGKTDFLARLPAGLPSGKVVIRHSSAVVEEPFETFASYDVLEKRTSSRTVGGETPGGKTASTTFPLVSVVVRHFDVDGVERRLPQERRNLGADYPPKKKQSAQPPIGR